MLLKTAVEYPKTLSVSLMIADIPEQITMVNITKTIDAITLASGTLIEPIRTIMPYNTGKEAKTVFIRAQPPG
jgi:hypothetical protein